MSVVGGFMRSSHGIAVVASATVASATVASATRFTTACNRIVLGSAPDFTWDISPEGAIAQSIPSN
jgi:hypothetical protein